ncbi:hypothetical protein, partial [Actinoplanes sp. GCM10030250]|uniref:hypothetical protein n=1 Tax=Actinoplanes sp. GCM10030250 TaxID=3273376 RepID=UPI00361BBAF9
MQRLHGSIGNLGGFTGFVAAAPTRFAECGRLVASYPGRHELLRQSCVGQGRDGGSVGRERLVAPAGIEVRRTMRRLKTKLEGIRDLREQLGLSRDPMVEVVLLTRTNRPYATKTGPDADVRAALTDGDLRLTVMDSQVQFHDDLYRQCYGLPLELEGTTYPQVAAELIRRWEAA